MKCNNCGDLNPDDAIYCSGCGCKITRVLPTSEPMIPSGEYIRLKDDIKAKDKIIRSLQSSDASKKYIIMLLAGVLVLLLVFTLHFVHELNQPSVNESDPVFLTRCPDGTYEYDVEIRDPYVTYNITATIVIKDHTIASVVLNKKTPEDITENFPDVSSLLVKVSAGSEWTVDSKTIESTRFVYYCGEEQHLDDGRIVYVVIEESDEDGDTTTTSFTLKGATRD